MYKMLYPSERIVTKTEISNWYYKQIDNCHPHIILNNREMVARLNQSGMFHIVAIETFG